MATVTKLDSAPKDAVALLKADHRAVSALFKEFAGAKQVRQIAIAREICAMLKVHAQIEEELFYPTVKPAIEPDVVNEAVVEQASAKDLVAQIEAMDGSEELFHATVTVLGEMIEHHADEEEDGMFKQARDTDIDLKALGQQMAARKAELEAAAA
jgi:hypothetical protein